MTDPKMLLPQPCLAEDAGRDCSVNPRNNSFLVNDIKNGHVQETIQFEWDNLILVGGIPTPLKNMTSPVGMMTFPI